ncbi:MAG: antibiotic biosynthesis monooxygenase [Proteobacteria bacterium]|nr:antibiotic biosynthesis monooxygenase [Pseudomonadota bacterium]
MAVTVPGRLQTCSIAMLFEPARLPQALEILASTVGPIRAKRGCKSCRVELDAGGERALRYSEEWDSEEAFHRHLRSEEFWRVLVAMDLCSEEPEVTIGELSAQYGLEALRKLRERPPGGGGN